VALCELSQKCTTDLLLSPNEAILELPQEVDDSFQRAQKRKALKERYLQVPGNLPKQLVSVVEQVREKIQACFDGDKEGEVQLHRFPGFRDVLKER
jgi:hypothetical protein